MICALSPLTLIKDGQETLERCQSCGGVPCAMPEHLDSGETSWVDLGCFPRKRSQQWWLENLGQIKGSAFRFGGALFYVQMSIFSSFYPIPSQLYSRK